MEFDEKPSLLFEEGLPHDNAELRGLTAEDAAPVPSPQVRTRLQRMAGEGARAGPTACAHL